MIESTIITVILLWSYYCHDIEYCYESDYFYESECFKVSNYFMNQNTVNKQNNLKNYNMLLDLIISSLWCMLSYPFFATSLFELHWLVLSDYEIICLWNVINFIFNLWSLHLYCQVSYRKNEKKEQLEREKRKRKR